MKLHGVFMTSLAVMVLLTGCRQTESKTVYETAPNEQPVGVETELPDTVHVVETTETETKTNLDGSQTVETETTIQSRIQRKLDDISRQISTMRSEPANQTTTQQPNNSPDFFDRRAHEARETFNSLKAGSKKALDSTEKNTKEAWNKLETNVNQLWNDVKKS